MPTMKEYLHSTLRICLGLDVIWGPNCYITHHKLTLELRRVYRIVISFLKKKRIVIISQISDVEPSNLTA